DDDVGRWSVNGGELRHELVPRGSDQDRRRGARVPRRELAPEPTEERLAAELDHRLGRARRAPGKSRAAPTADEDELRAGQGLTVHQGTVTRPPAGRDDGVTGRVKFVSRMFFAVARPLT